MPETLAVAPSVGDALLGRCLENALDQLPGRMRTVLILHDVEGYTHDEIGELMGVAPGTSKSQLFKARAKRRDLLQTLNASETQEVEAWSI